MLGRKRIAPVFRRQCISPRTNKLGESLCGKMDKGRQWLEESKMPPIGRIRGPEIHLRSSLIGCFPNFLRMSGVGVDSARCQASLRLIGPCSLALPVQSINLQDAALSRDLGWKIADFRTSHAVKVRSLALMPYCRGSDSVATRSVGTLKLIASGCQK
jgi:hypothetical protein